MAAEGPAVAQECVEGYLFHDDPLRLLLFRRPPVRGSIWVPISGKVDLGDRDLVAALRREVEEESGFTDLRSVRRLDWEFRFPGPDGRPWRLHGFAVELAHERAPRLSDEHDAFEWVDPAEALRRLHYADNRTAVERLLASLGRTAPATIASGPVGGAPTAAPDPAPASPVEKLIVAEPTVPVSAPASVFATVGPELFAAIRSAGYRKIVLQVPAGLVRNAHDLAARIRSETGSRVVVAARACFGGCDFPSPEETAGADAQVVLGHAPIPNVRRPLPVLFVEMRERGGDPEALATTVEDGGVPTRLGLVASVQHLDLVAPFVAALERRGYTVLTGTGDRRLAYPAQALGCNYTSASVVEDRVDAFLFLGTGRFHPIGLAFAVDRPVWSLDPLQNLLEPPIDRGALVRRRQLLVASCRDARRWGVLVSTFAGQDRSPMAAALVERARARGWEAEIFVAARIDPRDLEGRNVDAYVNTACPRIALDDSDLYPKPVLTPPEFLMALGDRPLEPYRFDTYH